MIHDAVQRVLDSSSVIHAGKAEEEESFSDATRSPMAKAWRHKAEMLRGQSDAVVTACVADCGKHMARLLGSRKAAHAQARVEDLAQLYVIADWWGRLSGLLGRQRSTAVPDEVVQQVMLSQHLHNKVVCHTCDPSCAYCGHHEQARQMLESVYERHSSTITMVLEGEKWKAVPVPREVQAVVTAIAQSRRFASELVMEKKSQAALLPDVAAAELTPKTVVAALLKNEAEAVLDLTHDGGFRNLLRSVNPHQAMSPRRRARPLAKDPDTSSRSVEEWVEEVERLQEGTPAETPSSSEFGSSIGVLPVSQRYLSVDSDKFVCTGATVIAVNIAHFYVKTALLIPPLAADALQHMLPLLRVRGSATRTSVASASNNTGVACFYRCITRRFPD